MDEEIRGLLAQHLPERLREKAEERIRQAAPHYLWFFTGVGPRKEKIGLCSACLQEMKCSDHPDRFGLKAIEYLKLEQAGICLHSGPVPALSNWKSEKKPITNSWKHGEMGVCPLCGTIGQYRSAAISRQYMVDIVNYCRYDNSRTDPEMLVMTLWQARIEWNEWNAWTEKEPYTNVRLTEICLMKRGWCGSRWTLVDHWDSHYQYSPRWEKKKECKSGYLPGNARPPFQMARTLWSLDDGSVEEALSGLHLMDVYSALSKAGACAARNYFDSVSLVCGILRWPCVEYLHKLGHPALAAAIVDRATGSEMNIRGKTAQKVLKIDENTWGWIKGKKISLDLRLLSMLHERDRLGLRLGNDTVLAISAGVYHWRIEQLRGLCKGLPAGLREKAIKYTQKKQVLPGDYMDHLDMMQRLKIPMADDAMLFPRDFGALHAELARRIEDLSNKEKDKQLIKRIEGLDMYWFSAMGLTLRPILSGRELWAEGNALHHCVASYYDRYAAGKVVILCLRRDEALDKPWHTVEFSTTGMMVQCRGFRNKTEPEDQPLIDEFWRLFDAWRIEYTNQHAREKRRENVA